jgi:hypothetical protein
MKAGNEFEWYIFIIPPIKRWWCKNVIMRIMLVEPPEIPI